MRILHLYRTYFPDTIGGIEQSIRQIALSTQRHGVESRVFTLTRTGAGGVDIYPEAEVVRARSRVAPGGCDIGGPAAVNAFRRAAQDADVVHVHFPWPFADFLVRLLGRYKPCVMTYHSDVVGKGVAGIAYRPFAMAALRRADRVVVTSPNYRLTSPVLKAYMKRSAPDLERLEVIPLGICEASSRQSVAAARTLDSRARFGLAESPFLLFLGGLRGYKGLNTLMEAVRHTAIPLVIAGDGDRELVAPLTQLSREQRAVHWLGAVTDAEKMALLRDCAGVVLPSDKRSEAFGLILVEAAMTGRPMISCEIGTGTSWVNRDGETGIVVPPGNADALRAAMQNLLDDPALAQSLGQAARLRYERLFSGEALGVAYADLYRQLAPGACRPAWPGLESQEFKRIDPLVTPRSISGAISGAEQATGHAAHAPCEARRSEPRARV